MKEIYVTKNEEGYKLKKLCMNYLDKAPASFIYKMLRKKNIVLNDKKADGNETLKLGDSVKFYLSDETIESFKTEKISRLSGIEKSKKLDIIYEDDNYIFCNKPVNMLSQKAKKDDVSINEIILAYLLESGSVTEDSLATFRPSVVNRLDRNTSGIILASKTPAGARILSELIRSRRAKKYYLACAFGKAKRLGHFKAYLRKDEKKNLVTVSDKPSVGANIIETDISLEKYSSSLNVSLLRIELITGKSHQIRSHLAYLGMPIIGDIKYGNKEINKRFKDSKGINSQMLFAYEISFPNIDDLVDMNVDAFDYKNLSGNTFSAKPPKSFDFIMKA